MVDVVYAEFSFVLLLNSKLLLVHPYYPYYTCFSQLLGINIFTVILAGLIIFFLSMNTILGVGWLGKVVGIPGTGSFEEVSPSLPGTFDLNRPEFRL